jgi:hypothetical protein
MELLWFRSYDVILLHQQPIRSRCHSSVFQKTAGQVSFFL